MKIDSKDLIIFDLDGTLAPSKSSLEPDMGDLLVKLIAQKKVAVISGGGFPQFETQFLRALPSDSSHFGNLFLLPTSGTRLYAWRGTWTEQYAEHLSFKEKQKILEALNGALRATNYEKPAQEYGDLIEDRGSQVTFSGLGQKAPLEKKLTWDPDRKKREKIAAYIHSRIPEFDVRLGGTTSIDITKKGVNKSYGIHKLEIFLKIPIDRMIYVGDALFHGGNDYPAKATGVDCIEVKGPEDTKKLIQGWVA